MKGPLILYTPNENAEGAAEGPEAFIPKPPNPVVADAVGATGATDVAVVLPNAPNPVMVPAVEVPNAGG